MGRRRDRGSGGADVYGGAVGVGFLAGAGRSPSCSGGDYRISPLALGGHRRYAQA